MNKQEIDLYFASLKATGGWIRQVRDVMVFWNFNRGIPAKSFVMSSIPDQAKTLLFSDACSRIRDVGGMFWLAPAKAASADTTKTPPQTPELA